MDTPPVRSRTRGRREAVGEHVREDDAAGVGHRDVVDVELVRDPGLPRREDGVVAVEALSGPEHVLEVHAPSQGTPLWRGSTGCHPALLRSRGFLPLPRGDKNHWQGYRRSPPPRRDPCHGGPREEPRGGGAADPRHRHQREPGASIDQAFSPLQDLYRERTPALFLEEGATFDVPP